MWRSHGFPKKSSTYGRISWCFCIQGTGTLLHYLSYLCIHGDYFCIHGDSQKKCGCFPFSPGASAMFLVFIPWHLPPPGLCLAHHLVVSRCHPSVASLFGACSCGTASVSWTPGLMAVRSDWRCAVLNVQCSVYIYIYIRETIYNKKI